MEGIFSFFLLAKEHCAQCIDGFYGPLSDAHLFGSRIWAVSVASKRIPGFRSFSPGKWLFILLVFSRSIHAFFLAEITCYACKAFAGFTAAKKKNCPLYFSEINIFIF